MFPGLTALRSDEVIDLMIKEYPTKHSEYSVILQERERQRIAKEYSVSPQTTDICRTNSLMINEVIDLTIRHWMKKSKRISLSVDF